ncbi:cubilin-like [Argopecten irradians]|uniref:cubilin-like n=1 Tax=Argopecten irradians TaxID=31199 RepID=UPI00371C8BE1
MVGTTETVIQSPSFPLSYGPGVQCSWTFRSHSYIELRIVETNFAPPVMWNDVVISEDNFASEDIVVCKDELIISSVNNEESTKNRLTYTNADAFRGTIIISSANELLVQFNSCFLYSKNTFRFFELRAKETEHGGCGIKTGNCFQTCTAMTGYIATERYPSGIFQTEACTWSIEGAFGQYVSLEILQLNLSMDHARALFYPSTMSLLAINCR